MAAYRMGFSKAAAPIIEPTNLSRTVVANFLETHEVNHILGKGYYAFLDMSPWLEKGGFADTAELGSVLAEGIGRGCPPGDLATLQRYQQRQRDDGDHQEGQPVALQEIGGSAGGREGFLGDIGHAVRSF
mgnify:CR=1 FL=1